MHVPTPSSLRALLTPAAVVASLFTSATGQAQETTPSPEPAVAPAATTAAPDAGAEAPSGSVAADPLGFLTFGPTLAAELQVGPVALSAYGRWLSAGLLAQSTFESDTEEFAFSCCIERRFQSESSRQVSLSGIVSWGASQSILDKQRNPVRASKLNGQDGSLGDVLLLLTHALTCAF